MLLNTLETGAGERVALLLHGMMGSAESWWRVAPLLAENGFRVLAVDLPGHGLSPRDEHCTVASVADDVVETVTARAPGPPVYAIGHSYGGTALAAVAERMPIVLAAYVDTTCSFDGGADRDALIAQYVEDRNNRRDPAWLLQTREYYSPTDAEVEARAAERFDPATMASISVGDDVRQDPQPGSILVRAVPSPYGDDADARRLASGGVLIRDIPGAAHSVWYSHFAEFTTALPEFFG